VSAKKYEFIHTEVRGRVFIVTIARPAVMNAIHPPASQEMASAWDGFDADPDLWVGIVTGEGERAFSAGADIKEFLESGTPTQYREERQRLDFRFHMSRCPQPIIAAIRGYALGGGLELALACDIRIAAEDAQLGLTEIDLAIIPGGGGTQRLPRVVGRGKALEMILTGARLPAAEALRIGLVERVVPVAELMTAAHGLARTLAAKAPIALRYAKEAVVAGLELPLADGLRLENDLSTPYNVQQFQRDLLTAIDNETRARLDLEIARTLLLASQGQLLAAYGFERSMPELSLTDAPPAP